MRHNPLSSDRALRVRLLVVPVLPPAAEELRPLLAEQATALAMLCAAVDGMLAGQQDVEGLLEASDAVHSSAAHGVQDMGVNGRQQADAAVRRAVLPAAALAVVGGGLAWTVGGSLTVAVTAHSEHLDVASKGLGAVSSQVGANAEETAAQANVVTAACEQVSANVQTVATAVEEVVHERA